MTHLEENYEEWKEIRGRIDSVANAVFLISGGALSLSITVILNISASEHIPAEISRSVASSWYWLLATIFIFLFLKGKLILQSYLLQFHTDFHKRWLTTQNVLGWVIGLAGFVAFSVGMGKMVHAAVMLVGA